MKLYRDISSKDQAALAKSDVFDADWYCDRYPDVALSGLDPLHHFRTIGIMLGRDPGPGFSERFQQFANPWLADSKSSALMRSLRGKPAEIKPGRALLAASHMQDTGETELAQQLLDAQVPPNLAYSAAILRANAALAAGDEDGWLAQVNAYLKHDGGIAPLELEPGLAR